MPIHLASAGLEKLFSWETYPTLAACVVAAIVLKRWSAGVDLLARLDRATSDQQRLRERDAESGHEHRPGGSASATIVPRKELRPRDLHGNVIVVVGGFTSQGLLTCSQLSALGAQLILLTPSLKSERILQMIHLLRDGTSNALIYAEECDVTSLASVEAFAAQWNLGEGKGSAAGGIGAGPAGGLSGSTGLGSTGGGQQPNGGESEATAPRRIDALIFLPLDDTRHSIGDGPRETDEAIEVGYAEVLGRFHLVNLLLPSILLLPPHRDVRIISLVSPWYAAGVADARLDNLDLKGSTSAATKGSRTRFPSHSPWRIDGAQSLKWLALSRELQRRIQLMADADKRSRTKLPGIDDRGRPIGVTPTNVNLVNVCAGFERGRDMLDYLLPSARQEVTSWEDDDDEDDERSSQRDANTAQSSAINRNSVSASTHAELRKFLDPRQQRQSVPSTRGTQKQRQQQQAQAMSARLDKQISARSSLLARLFASLRLVLAALLWPVVWLLCKSPKRAAETLTWATIAPLVPVSTQAASHLEVAALVDRAAAETGGAPVVVPGELHREGKVVRPVMPDSLVPGVDGAAKLWNAVESNARAIIMEYQHKQQQS